MGYNAESFVLQILFGLKRLIEIHNSIMYVLEAERCNREKERPLLLML
jgi:hypothetical protein